MKCDKLHNDLKKVLIVVFVLDRHKGKAMNRHKGKAMNRHEGKAIKALFSL